MATVPGTVVKDIDNTEARAKIDAPAQRANVQAITASGAATVDRYVDSVELFHATQITAVIPDASYHPGLFMVKQTGSGTAGHTLTLAIGSFDGTNNTATLNAVNECLLVYFDQLGNGSIVENIGSVTLSAV